MKPQTNLITGTLCADCNKPITGKNEPPDGWQLSDGRTVCGHCCAQDLKAVANLYGRGDTVDVPEGVKSPSA